MSTNASSKKQPHHGQNIKRLREILGKKQELLADELGIAQSGLSKLEGKEKISDSMLEKIAASLNIPVDFIKNMTDEHINNIASNAFTDFKDNAVAGGSFLGNQENNSFPIEKFMEFYDQIAAEKEERAKLFEKIDSLEKKLAEKK